MARTRGGQAGVTMERDVICARLAAARSGPGRGDHDLNPDLRPTRSPTSAAVLVPIVLWPAGMTILLTQRSDNLNDHAGQISFPGGRIEPDDADAARAAIREMQEEVGIEPDRVEVVGELDLYVTRTGFQVTPIVAFVNPPFTVKPDPFEVAEVFEMPLSYLLDPANLERHSRQFEGRTRYFYAIPYGEHYIWGATAGMLVNLVQVLRGS